jgi:hypothetical protein
LSLLPLLDALSVVLLHQNQEPLDNIINNAPTDSAGLPNQPRLPLPPQQMQAFA